MNDLILKVSSFVPSCFEWVNYHVNCEKEEYLPAQTEHDDEWNHIQTTMNEEVIPVRPFCLCYEVCLKNVITYQMTQNQ